MQGQVQVAGRKFRRVPKGSEGFRCRLQVLVAGAGCPDLILRKAFAHDTATHMFLLLWILRFFFQVSIVRGCNYSNFPAI